MGSVIAGAIIGAAIAWVIGVIRGPSYKHIERGWFRVTPARMGCFSYFLLTIILAGIGALIGAIVGGVF